MKPMGPEGLRERAKEFGEFYAKNLTPHFEAEEKVLFPTLRSLAPESGSLIEELLRQHKRMRKWAADIDDESNLAKMIHDIGDLLEQHIRREERELFPLFESKISEGEGEKIKREIESIIESRTPGPKI